MGPACLGWSNRDRGACLPMAGAAGVMGPACLGLGQRGGGGRACLGLGLLETVPAAGLSHGGWAWRDLCRRPGDAGGALVSP